MLIKRVYKHGNWTLTLNIGIGGFRIYAPIINKPDFLFALERVEHKRRPRYGREMKNADLTRTGTNAFDERFILRSNQHDVARTLFGNKRLRKLLLALSEGYPGELYFYIRDEYKPFPFITTASPQEADVLILTLPFLNRRAGKPDTGLVRQALKIFELTLKLMAQSSMLGINQEEMTRYV